MLVEFNVEMHKYENFNKLCNFLEAHMVGEYDLVTKKGLSLF